MNKFKMIVRKIRVYYYEVLYRVTGWRCDRLHKKRMRAIIRLDDYKFKLKKTKAELIGEGT